MDIIEQILQGLEKAPGTLVGSGVDLANIASGIIAGKGMQGLVDKPAGGSRSINSLFGLDTPSGGTGEDITATLSSLINPGMATKGALIGAVLPFSRKVEGGESLVQTIKNAALELENHGKAYMRGDMEFGEFADKNTELIAKKLGAEQKLKKYQEGIPATTINEVHPGYTEIPVGTKVLGTHGLNYPEPTMGTVVGRRGLRNGPEATILPTVDFGDGKARPLLPSDIHKVFTGPK